MYRSHGCKARRVAAESDKSKFKFLVSEKAINPKLEQLLTGEMPLPVG
jgi:hypothetical protein